jgi:hypothetical protein
MRLITASALRPAGPVVDPGGGRSTISWQAIRAAAQPNSKTLGMGHGSWGWVTGEFQVHSADDPVGIEVSFITGR